MAGQQRADCAAGSHHRSGAQVCPHRFVAGTQAAGVRDGDDRPSGQYAGEHHRPALRRSNALTWCSGQIDATMPALPAQVRTVEGTGDRRSWP